MTPGPMTDTRYVRRCAMADDMGAVYKRQKAIVLEKIMTPIPMTDTRYVRRCDTADDMGAMTGKVLC